MTGQLVKTTGVCCLPITFTIRSATFDEDVKCITPLPPGKFTRREKMFISVPCHVESNRDPNISFMRWKKTVETRGCMRNFVRYILLRMFKKTKIKFLIEKYGLNEVRRTLLLSLPKYKYNSRCTYIKIYKTDYICRYSMISLIYRNK